MSTWAFEIWQRFQGNDEVMKIGSGYDDGDDDHDENERESGFVFLDTMIAMMIMKAKVKATQAVLLSQATWSEISSSIARITHLMICDTTFE